MARKVLFSTGKFLLKGLALVRKRKVTHTPRRQSVISVTLIRQVNGSRFFKANLQDISSRNGRRFFIVDNHPFDENLTMVIDDVTFCKAYSDMMGQKKEKLEIPIFCLIGHCRVWGMASIRYVTAPHVSADAEIIQSSAA